MIKVDIVNCVVEIFDVLRVKVVVVVDLIIDVMKVVFSEGKWIEFCGFGVFQVCDCKCGVGCNLKIGVEVVIMFGKIVCFKFGKEFKNF